MAFFWDTARVVCPGVLISKKFVRQTDWREEGAVYLSLA